ncbi:MULTISPECIES: metallophosphoesterase family protein [unclassified Methylocaldum]|uniref:metallophosphoesterase family protein n=1 Tax=unclassified Methylocaldum TaxID=2622260 RepID=UPI000989C9B9|nr:MULTISPECIES: metallophosphoesterase family protein [unclassified Methylocaldum]MBP1152153.1 3',5'-cyclic AMP phosphodiesterase CpdA [Methylocaldum sp. RMAD-M]
MRTIVHLSDLHFGRVDSSLVDPLIQSVREIGPDLVAISGDLTQRARTAQFLEARRFLDALPKPQIVVPGNHDVPLYNPLARFFRPLVKYRRYIGENIEPFYADEQIAVVGVNTARSLTVKNGRVNRRQLDRIRERLCDYPGAVIKIVVTHHPFDLPEGFREGDLVGRARMAMEALASCGVDMFLAGHLHVSHSGHTGERYRIAGYKALVISAGTALSVRTRKEKNAFNVLRIEHPKVVLERCTWESENARFVPSAAEYFERRADGWMRMKDDAAGPCRRS